MFFCQLLGRDTISKTGCARTCVADSDDAYLNAEEGDLDDSAFVQPVHRSASAADLLHWFDSLDPTQKVGSRHHTVPQFYLERWADESGQTRMYSRDTSELFK